MEDNREILEKIKKLLALSQSPNEAEAASAAVKAQELLQKYNLSMATVESAQEGIECIDIERGSRQAKWRMILLSALAHAYFAQLIVISGNGKYIYQLVGKPHNVDVARSMFEYLEAAINRISREDQIKKQIRRSSDAFRLGMAHAIASRLDKKRSGSLAERLFTTSLVHDLYASEHAQIAAYIKGMGNVKYKSTTLNVTSRGDFRSGLAAGKKVSLNDQLSRKVTPLKQIE